MNDYATTKDVEKIVSKGTDEILDVLQTFISQVDDRFNTLEKRMEEYDRKLDGLLNTIDGFVARINSYEIELVARDHKIARLEKYIEVLADKAGVDLSSVKL